jgi:hypothetical protein
MAESKNIFLKSKMNKDFDNRLLPEGEYRDALNISVGKSESQNVGSLQNILGNQILQKPSGTGTVDFEADTTLVCIGFVVDNEKNRIYQFLTNYTDGNPSLNELPPDDRTMKISVYDANNSGNPYTSLVEGTFLNFSTTNIITGVNILENLLFWTDNRNQPRKINIDSALANSAESSTPYYTNSEQLSVAKYAPFKSPLLYSEVNNIDVILTPTYTGENTRLEILTEDIQNLGLTIGCQLISEEFDISQGDSAIVVNIVEASATTSYVYITGIWSITAPTTLGFYKSSMRTDATAASFSGNNNFLQDKFIRFSYRFKFDDNEYSLMAPFTQPAFIPRQKGYFISGDEEAAYRSTVLEWMENSINEVGLFIELPDNTNNIYNNYKIKSIDILYKESDSLAVKVVETVDIAKVQLQFPNTNLYLYKYRSQKPKKTLQEAETLRVSDKVPVRALAQEVSGNRIMYGNFVNQNTPPANIDYNITVIDKDVPFTGYVAWAEYPTHTLKENRTYQVGFVLSDKFGRESSVILSSAEPFISEALVSYSASSVFVPYKNEQTINNVKEWLGNELIVILNNVISSSKDEATGTPGLYATVSGSIENSSEGFQIISGSIVGNVYTFELPPLPLSPGDPQPQVNIPVIGGFLRGKYRDYVKVTNVIPDPIIPATWIVTTEYPINDLYLPNEDSEADIKYAYAINEGGWYSYKIVVKQQEQEYYNVYVPGMLAGYPDQTVNTFPANFEDTVTCHFVSINDNINKVPRDLSEVGPNQTQYRSSAQLWTRVANNLADDNAQYYPSTLPEVVNTIAPTNDLNFLPYDATTNPIATAPDNFYQFDTTPLINRVSTTAPVGVTAATMAPVLGVFETEPVSSALDIFWETSTTGYISDINYDVLSGSDSIIGTSDLDFLYREDQNYDGDGEDTGATDSPFITDYFYFRNTAGVRVNDIDSLVFTAKAGGIAVVGKFELIRNNDILSDFYEQYRIKILQSDYYFGINADVDTAFEFIFNITHTVGDTTYNPTISTGILKLTNVAPVILNPALDNETYYLPYNPAIAPIIDCVGENGNVSPPIGGITSPNRLADLYWSLESNAYPLYFDIESDTGVLKCLSTTVPGGNYELTIKLQDACNVFGVQSPAVGPLFAERIVYIDVATFTQGCSNFTGDIGPPIGEEPEIVWPVRVNGYINLWKLLNPGETIVSSTVTMYKYTDEGDNTYILGEDVVQNPLPVTFLQDALYTGNGNFNGVVRLTPTLDFSPVAIKLFFQGEITTSEGRPVFVDFFIEGGVTGTPNESASTSCTIVPDGYIPQTTAGFTIFNNSNLPVVFSGLAADGETIIGGTIAAGGNARSISQGGTYPDVRENSITATGAVTVDVIITYYP